jgi:thiamine-phosphate pyrophosphorylase
LEKFRSYLITDPSIYGSEPLEFTTNLSQTFNKHYPDLVCFRDKHSPNKSLLASIFINLSKEFGVPMSLINSDIELAIKLGYDGVHLNSQQFDLITQVKAQNLYTIISTHNQEEIELAIKNGADAITYSPIFDTPNKGAPKGIENFKNVVDIYSGSIDIFALGGIVTKEHIDKIKGVNASGFASIRYFGS